jgi:hypothetical protein
MRDPERIPLILAALEREWRKHPNSRLGQLLVNLHRRRFGQEHPNPLFGVEDGTLLELLGPETDEEKRYVSEEPAARRRGWSEWQRRQIERRDDE